ncbi:helix-hairpin-helix domain-containing protein [Secundilactobacillus kimchicus]|nr:helix-hairpin-helix domain-containing protein [Secundilactobacillus kimchicus]
MKEILADHVREVIIGGIATILVLMAMVVFMATQSTSDATSSEMGDGETSEQMFSATSASAVASSAASDSSAPSAIYVDVKGAVHDPGLKKMTGDMRIVDVVQEAGGFTKQADQRQVNLAQRVTDQQVVFIPQRGEKAPQGTTGTMGTGQATTGQGGQQAPEVDLNNADVTQLQQLDGVGEKKAEKIIQYREQNGQFKSVDDLKNVSGFGDKTLERLKPQLRV